METEVTLAKSGSTEDMASKSRMNYANRYLAALEDYEKADSAQKPAFVKVLEELESLFSMAGGPELDKQLGLIGTVQSPAEVQAAMEFAFRAKNARS